MFDCERMCQCVRVRLEELNTCNTLKSNRHDMRRRRRLLACCECIFQPVLAESNSRKRSTQ